MQNHEEHVYISEAEREARLAAYYAKYAPLYKEFVGDEDPYGSIYAMEERVEEEAILRADLLMKARQTRIDQYRSQGLEPDHDGVIKAMYGAMEEAMEKHTFPAMELSDKFEEWLDAREASQKGDE